MTDNFIERNVYSLGLSRRSIRLLPEDHTLVPRDVDEQARHVEYFPRPDVVTSRTTRQSGDRLSER